MRFSPRVDRISGDGADAWNIHHAAVTAQRGGADIIMMSVGDPDFATPAPIVERAVAALRGGDTHYTDIPGRPALRAAIARDHAERGGAEVGAENVIVLGGAQNALFATSLCLFEPGDEVLALDPMYVTYEASVRVSGADIVAVAPRPESGFRPDLAGLERAISPRSRAILFSNPSNPTGVVMTKAELTGIAEIARRHDLWVIADEVYAALAFDAPHLSISALPGMRERTATVASLSKSQAMTGWRCGWIVAPEPLVQHLERLALCMLYGSPGFIQEGALVALTLARGEMDGMRDIYRHRRDLLHAALSQAPELVSLKPEAGMFLLVDIRQTGLTASEFSWGLLREEGVSVLDATAFGPSAAGFVRLSYALDDDQLTDAATRIQRFAASAARMTRQDRASA